MPITTPDMNLILPDVSITPGPQWATLLNAAFARIDAHDHTVGNGVQLTPASLNISSDLSFEQNNATNLRTTRFYNYGVFSLNASDRTALYVQNGELYYVDAAGTPVQITLNGAVDVGNSIESLSIKDSGLFVQYFGDVTRQFRFNASAIPTNTTRILSVPDSGANDTLVTQNATQTLTNKTLTAPAISNPAVTGITNVTTSPAPTPPAAGSANIYVSNVDGQLHLMNSAGVDTPIGSGGSSGTNYLQTYYGFGLNPVTGAAVGLTATGNRLTGQSVFGVSTPSATTLMTYNTATPLRAPGDLQLTFPAAGQFAFVETPMFALDLIDANTPTQYISFESSLLTVNAVAGDITVVVVEYDATGNYIGVLTPSITNVPTGYYKFKTAFNPSSSTTSKYSLRFRVNTTSATTMDIQDIIVGPQFVTQSDAIGAWQPYTPTLTGFGVPTGIKAFYRRVGDSAEVQLIFGAGTVTAALASVSLPPLLTIDTGKVEFTNTAAQSPRIGSFSTTSANSSGAILAATLTNTSVVYFGSLTTSANMMLPQLGSTVVANAGIVTAIFTVPIAQWTNTVNLAGNANIEYAYNTSGITAANASNTTSFGYGAQGAIIGSIASTTAAAFTTMRVRFQTPIQPTDRIQLEFATAAGGPWFPVSNSTLAYGKQNSSYYGMYFALVGNNTDVDVRFGNQGSTADGVTYSASSSSAWGGTTRWRVAKYSAVGLAELAPATQTSQGSISRESNWTPYTPTLAGFGTTTALSAFYRVIGDSLFVRLTFATGTVAATLGSVSLPSGMQVDSSKMTRQNTTAQVGEGVGIYTSNNPNQSGRVLTATGTSTTLVYIGSQFTISGGFVLIPAANTSTNIANTTTVNMTFEVPFV